LAVSLARPRVSIRRRRKQWRRHVLFFSVVLSRAYVPRTASKSSGPKPHGTTVKRSKQRSSVRPTSPRVTTILTALLRAAHPLVFQYRDARDDRHGAESYLTRACKSLDGDLQRELLQELYKPDVLEDLLKESEWSSLAGRRLSAWSRCSTKMRSVSSPFCFSARLTRRLAGSSRV
jgi:hypothetical protein